MTWLSLLSALLGLARVLADYLASNRMIDLGAKQAILKGLKDADDAIAKARAAREAVRAELNRDPAKLRDDDGLKRPD